MDDHSLQYGLEFEVVSILSNLQIKRKLTQLFPKFKVQYNIANTRNLKGKISLTGDFSAGFEPDDPIEMQKLQSKYIRNKNILVKDGIEIVFPIVSKQMANRICRKMEKHFFNTGIMRINKNCGLHINTSFVHKKIHSKLDLSKLAISFDVTAWRKTFNRTRNRYCLKWMNAADIRSSYRGSNGDVDHFLDTLHSRLINKSTKEHAINTTNYDSDTGSGRIEFRVAGGTNAMSSVLIYQLIDAIETAMIDSVDEKCEHKIIQKINEMLAA